MSPELKEIFKAINFCLFDQNKDSIDRVNLSRLKKLVEYHSTRLLMYQYLQAESYADNGELKTLRNQWRVFAQNQALLSLQHRMETDRVCQILEKEGIPCLPMKGALYLRKVYKNVQLREFSDIDLLVSPDHAAHALDLLFKDGYLRNVAINGLKKPNNATVDEIVADPVLYEYPIFKRGLHIDFHWDVCYNFLPYRISLALFLDNSYINTQGNREVSSELLLVQMVLHHGGKECWLKLKNVADLGAFIKNTKDVNWPKTIEILKDARLLSTFKVGLYLLQSFTVVTLPSVLSELIQNFKPKKLSSILKYWERAEHWGNPVARVRSEQILIAQQDDDFSLRKYIADFYKSYSLPASKNEERPFSLPEKYRLLNFAGKVLSYFQRKLL